MKTEWKSGCFGLHRCGLPTVALLVIVLAAQPVELSAAEPSARELAAYWAPVIVQDLEYKVYREGYLTRFDYDGDWIGTNNLDNASSFDLPAFVYYWVTETEKHAFLGYGLFHVAGKIFGEQYENDMSGLVVVVEKSLSSEYPAGRFVAVMTAAQSVLEVAAERDTALGIPALNVLWEEITAPSRALTAAEGVTIDDLDFTVDEHGFHPVIYAEANGQGLTGSADLTDRPKTFQDGRVVDWSDRPWGPKVYPDHQRGRGGFLGLAEDGVVFRYHGEAQVTIQAQARGRGRFPHHWEVIGYDLLPLAELWQHRENYLAGKDMFEDDGVFAGRGPRGPGTRAPWDWTGPPSELFQSPGKLLQDRVEGVTGLSSDKLTPVLE
jgi:hypothetical protein